MTITIQMSVKRKQEDEGPTDPEATEAPRKETKAEEKKMDEEVKVTTNDAPADEKKEKDLSDPANNHLIRKYLVAIEKEDKLFLQELRNGDVLEKLRNETRKKDSIVQVNLKVDQKDIGTLEVSSPSTLSIKTGTPNARWHPFDAIMGYQFVLADPTADMGCSVTRGLKTFLASHQRERTGPRQFAISRSG